MAYTTIDDPESYFQTELWGGTDGSHQINFSGTNDMSPNFVWIKERGTNSHWLFDSVRGVQKYLHSNTNAAEATNSNSLTAFGSDSFTIGSEGAINAGGVNFIGWSWKESATAGFDIVSYTGNGANRTIAHNLSPLIPKMIIFKNRARGDNWDTYHHSIGNGSAIFLNSTSAPDDQTLYFNDTTPTSSVFTIGTNTSLNANTEACIAYVFADVQGFSKFGSYVGNGNADGTMIVTGMRPAFVICKNISGTGNWGIKTAKSQAYNGADVTLFANSTGGEGAFSDNKVDLLSNGFKIRTASSDFNTSGSNYIYMAFAEQPFVNSNGVPCNAR